MHDTLGSDDTPTYQISLKGSGSEDARTNNEIFPEDLNPHCDLDLEHSNHKLAHNPPAHDDAPLHQIWLQKVTKIRIWKKVHF